MTINEALNWSKKLLEEKEVENPKASAEFLLRQVLGVDKSYLISHSDKKLNLSQERKFKSWVKKRSKHEPVWYITGKIEFFGQDFSVNKNVLIPRPETELILERIIKENKAIESKKILDLGTGSGAIILTLVKELNGYCSREQGKSRTQKVNSSRRSLNNKYYASDISPSALRVAKKNAKNLLPPRHSREGGNLVTFKKGDLFGPWVGQKFDLIVANLPYITHEEMSTLAFDITHYEPRLALDGGKKGVEIYQRFFEELPSFVSKNAKLYLEIGDKQGSALEKMAKKALPEAKIQLISDYAEQDRLVIIET